MEINHYQSLKMAYGWKQLFKGESSILWNDVLWFDNKLWLASDYNFRIWNGKEMEVVAHKGEPVKMIGHMDAHDGILVIGGMNQVMLFDGKEWRVIVAAYE